ncbi:MAG: hypothetical protein KGY41_07645, partial [Desulfovermiculus sp.]|nr:hypothetical protein [Desulfovermiculus sp.]
GLIPSPYLPGDGGKAIARIGAGGGGEATAKAVRGQTSEVRRQRSENRCARPSLVGGDEEDSETPLGTLR